MLVVNVGFNEVNEGRWNCGRDENWENVRESFVLFCDFHIIGLNYTTLNEEET